MRDLYELHGRALYRYLLGLSYGQPQLAEDLVQETLLRAWRNIESLNPDVNTLLPWLFTVARRVAIDAARARKVRPAQSDDADVAEHLRGADLVAGRVDGVRAEEVLQEGRDLLAQARLLGEGH